MFAKVFMVSGRKLCIPKNSEVLFFVYLMYLLFSQDIYKVLDDVLGQGAHTTVKSCVKLATNQEYAVKVRELYCCDRLFQPVFPLEPFSLMLPWENLISILLP